MHTIRFLILEDMPPPRPLADRMMIAFETLSALHPRWGLFMLVHGLGMPRVQCFTMPYKQCSEMRVWRQMIANTHWSYCGTPLKLLTVKCSVPDTRQRCTNNVMYTASSPQATP